jgi:tetratricopeptide (TPR) repeat protein
MSNSPHRTDECGRLVDTGVQLAGQGCMQEAIDFWQAAIALDPDHVDAHHNIGAALSRLGQLEQAKRYLRRTLELRPDHAEACFNLANLVWKSEGPVSERETETIQLLRQAIALKPALIEARYKLGTVLNDCRRFEEAAATLRDAFDLSVPGAPASAPIDFAAATAQAAHPLTASICNQLGVAYCALLRHQESEAAYCAAIGLRPQFAEAFSNLGNCYQEQARLPEAIASYEYSVALNPNLPITRLNLALARLQNGDLAHGWPEYEWRWHLKDLPPAFHGPYWDGSPLEGRTIFVYLEQGLGDAIQFLRFLPLVQARGGRVVLECPAFLEPLVSRCPGIDALTLDGAPLPAYDVQAALMSLPGLLGITLNNLPAEVPYLFLDDELTAKWQKRLAEVPGLKVGILWQGDPRYSKDRFRSTALEPFLDLARIEGVQLVSLQTGPAAEQLSRLEQPAQVLEVMESRQVGPGTLIETAALIKALDLVISIDSGLAHIAGALGRPIWVPLAVACDWRWFVHRSDSPWYPTMRLFRQTKPGQWSDVFRTIGAALRERLANR